MQANRIMAEAGGKRSRLTTGQGRIGGWALFLCTTIAGIAESCKLSAHFPENGLTWVRVSSYHHPRPRYPADRQPTASPSTAVEDPASRTDASANRVRQCAASCAAEPDNLT